MDARHLYSYLEAMTRPGFIEKEPPLLGSKRQGLYRIKDSIFDFWYNFVNVRRQEIETENYSADAIDLNPYFGKQFEVFVRNEFARSFLPGYSIGRWWNRGEEVDLVAVRENDGSIVIGSIGSGECKWGNSLSRRLILSSRDLSKKQRVSGMKSTQMSALPLSLLGLRGRIVSGQRVSSSMTLRILKRCVNSNGRNLNAPMWRLYRGIEI